MKRNKKLLTLLGVLLAVSIAAVCISGYEQKKEQIRTSGETVLAVPVDSVQSIQWKYDDTELAFHKDETWVYDADEAFPVDSGKIETLLDCFADLKAAFVIEAPENTADYGIGDPTCTITFSTADQSYRVVLGSFSTLDSQRYLTIGDENVYLVENDPMEVFKTQLSNYIQNDEIPQMDQIQTISFTGEENYSLSYQEDNHNSVCKDDSYYADLSGTSLPLKTENITNYVKALQSVDLGDYASYNATAEELESFGLKDPAVTAQIDYTTEDGDAQSFCFSLGQNQDELKKAEESEDEDVTVTRYIRIGDSQIVYTLSESKYEALAACTSNDLRHEEVMAADFADVTEMVFTLENKSYTITSEPGDDDTRKYFYEGQELDELQISTLRTAVRSMKASAFTGEKPSGKVEIKALYTLDNEACPTQEITLYRQDGTNCLAVVDGTPVCQVSRSAAVDLIEAVNAIVLGSAES